MIFVLNANFTEISSQLKLFLTCGRYRQINWDMTRSPAKCPINQLQGFKNSSIVFQRRFHLATMAVLFAISVSKLSIFAGRLWRACTYFICRTLYFAVFLVALYVNRVFKRSKVSLRMAFKWFPFNHHSNEVRLTEWGPVC